VGMDTGTSIYGHLVGMSMEEMFYTR